MQQGARQAGEAHLRSVHILAANGQQNLANGHTSACALGLSKGSTHSSLHHTILSMAGHITL